MLEITTSTKNLQKSVDFEPASSNDSVNRGANAFIRSICFDALPDVGQSLPRSISVWKNRTTLYQEANRLMRRLLSLQLLSVVLVLLAIVLHGVPAAEPAHAASVPTEKGGRPAVGPSAVRPGSGSGTATSSALPSGMDPANTSPGKGPVLHHCDVKLIQEVEVPGVEAGVLMAVEAKEGMDVRAGMTLGHIDDREPRMQKTISKIKHEAAQALAENDIDIRFAKKSAEVANYEYLKIKEANNKVKGAVSGVDAKKAELAAEKARLGIEKAVEDRRQSVFESDTKEAEVLAAELSIARRQIKAPFDGRVTNVFRHPGDWVAPGDSVFKLIQLDRLRVEGFLSAADYDPAQIDGRLVFDRNGIGARPQSEVRGPGGLCQPAGQPRRRVCGVCRGGQPARKWSMGTQARIGFHNDD